MLLRPGSSVKLLLRTLLLVTLGGGLPIWAQIAITFNPSPYLFLGRTATLTATVPTRGNYQTQWIKDGAPLGGPYSYTNTSTLSRTIGPVQASDAGEYSIRVLNADGTFTSSAIVRFTVVDPIVITAHPQSVTVNVGASATFSATATGPAPLTYQWYEDFFGAAVALPGATSLSLTVSNLPAYTSRTFYLEVKSPYQTARTIGATVTVLSPPRFTRAPAAVKISSVEGVYGIDPGPIEGTPPFTFKWLKDGTEVTLSSTLRVSTDGTLHIDSASDASSGEYRLIASNAYGTATSEAVRFTYTAAPKLLPVGVGYGIGTLQEVIAGGTATFTVAATGSPPPTYQWRFNGTAIPGATGTTLVIPNVTAANAGDYTVSVSNPYGTVVSFAAMLIVRPGPQPPAISGQTASFTIDAGRTVSVSVSATGNSPLSYQWYFNGTPLPGATGMFLNFDSIKTSQAGSYTATVSNSLGRATSQPIIITVVPPSTAPTIGTQPEDQSVNIGSNANFVVGATATGLEYQWRKNGAPIPGATNFSLFISNVQPGDAGGYSVEIWNSLGRVTSRTATLTVSTGLPEIISQPQPSMRLNAGQELHLVFSVTGTNLRFQWQHNGTDIAGATSAALLIPVVQAADAGDYRLLVSNGSGTVRSNAIFVTVLPPLVPIPPTRLGNLSVRAQVAPGDTLTVGLVTNVHGVKSFLIRGVGPSLRQFGLTDVFENPSLAMYASGGRLVTQNAGWLPGMADVFQQVGAFPLTTGSNDAAIWIATDPGAYTVQLSSTSGAGGIALIEAYDTSLPGTPGRYVNLSVRGRTGEGAGTLLAGFVITGSGLQNVLVRGIGPTLQSFGVSDAIAHPRLALRHTADGRETVLASNAGWGGADILRRASERVGAFALPVDSRDAAVIMALPPGSYTAEVTNDSGSAGTALVEIYAVPE